MVTDRLYIQGKLISWHQRRCSKCQRFLSIRQRNLCAKCGIQADYDNKERIHKEGRNIYHLYSIRAIREITNIPMPYQIRQNLRPYL